MQVHVLPVASMSFYADIYGYKCYRGSSLEVANSTDVKKQHFLTGKTLTDMTGEAVRACQR